MTREFYIDTPLGRLRVWAKHDTDSPEDYPGVFVDLKRNDGSFDCLACVEYDSGNDRLQTCAYQPGHDEPQEIVVHELDGDELPDNEPAAADAAKPIRIHLEHADGYALDWSADTVAEALHIVNYEASGFRENCDPEEVDEVFPLHWMISGVESGKRVHIQGLERIDGGKVCGEFEWKNKEE